MKKRKTKNGVAYEIVEPTETAVDLSLAIYKIMRDNDVQPEDVLPVLGEAVIRFLVPLASKFGCNEKELVKLFGKGLIEAEFDFCRVKEEEVN